MASKFVETTQGEQLLNVVERQATYKELHFCDVLSTTFEAVKCNTCHSVSVSTRAMLYLKPAKHI